MSLDFTRWALPAMMAAIRRTNRRRLFAAAENVESAQGELLRSILSANQATLFGQKHNFSSVTDWDSFRDHVPIQSYDSLKPYIEQQIQSGTRSLVEAPIASLARTSGTTGPTKDIPLTDQGLWNIRDAQRQLALTLYEKTKFFDGKILALFSPHVEGRLQNGLTYGASSGQANRYTSFLLRRKFAYPQEISALGDYDLKYYLYVLFGLLESDVTGIATANPSSVCRLAEIANERRRELREDLAAGDLSRHRDLPSGPLAASFRQLAAKRRGRIDEAVALLDGANELKLSDFWPRLNAVAVWTGGSCAVALAKLEGLVPPATKFVEIGYRASEFIGSINIDADRNLCLPAVHHTLFEFIEQKAWEAGREQFTPISELEVGSNYYVFVTTASGLYRYDINDIVQVGEFCHGCPTISFLQKGKGVTSITGEKLYAHQAMGSIASVTKKLGTKLEFCLLLADEAAAAYNVLIESGDGDSESTARFTAELDKRLMEANIEYGDKRRSGRLKEPKPLRLKSGAGEALKRDAIARGQREAQYKTPCLDYAANIKFDFGPWLHGEQNE